MSVKTATKFFHLLSDKSDDFLDGKQIMTEGQASSPKACDLGKGCSGQVIIHGFQDSIGVTS